MTEVITIRRFITTGTDQYGNPQTTLVFINHRAMVAMGHGKTSSEASRTPYDAFCDIYLAKGTEIQESDEFEIRGEIWTFDSLQSWAPTSTGIPAGVMVKLFRRRG